MHRGMGNLSTCVRRAGPAIERRREPRYPAQKLVRIIYNMGEQPVWVIQCSARGVAILNQQPIRVGEQFTIQLKLEALTLLVYVVRFCREERNGVYRIGGELVRVSAPGQIGFHEILEALRSP